MKILNSFFDGTSDRYEVSKASVLLHSDTSVILAEILNAFRFQVSTLERPDITSKSAIVSCII